MCFRALISRCLLSFGISLHGISWLYKHHGDSPCCWALWPQFIHLANTECVAIGKRGKNLYSRLVYCKISDDIAVDSESQLLLPRASRGFTVRH